VVLPNSDREDVNDIWDEYNLLKLEQNLTLGGFVLVHTTACLQKRSYTVPAAVSEH